DRLRRHLQLHVHDAGHLHVLLRRPSRHDGNGGGQRLSARAPTEHASRSPWRVTGVRALVGAGMIHAAAMPAHLREWWVAGAFFAGIWGAPCGTQGLAAGVSSAVLEAMTAGAFLALAYPAP